MSAATAEGCDGAFWHIIKTETQDKIISRVMTTVYRYDEDKKIKPNENHGFYKYDVLMIRTQTKEAEFMSACIGDVDFFINAQAANGFNGLLVKNGVIPKRTKKKMFNLILSNLNFPEKKIKTILTEVK